MNGAIYMILKSIDSDKDRLIKVTLCNFKFGYIRKLLSLSLQPKIFLLNFRQ